MSIFGAVLGRIAGSIFGSMGGSSPPPVEVSVTVRAIEPGYFDGNLIEIGQTFEITSPEQYSPYWMLFIDTPPFSWNAFLRPFNVEVESDRIRWPGKDVTILTAPGGPSVS